MTTLGAEHPECVSNSGNGVVFKHGGARPGSGRKPRQVPPVYAGPRWYCLLTLARCMQDVDEAVRSAGYETYLPLVVERRPDSLPRIVPAFPGYLLVRFDAQDVGWRHLLSVHWGVLRLFCVSPERPTPIRDSVVAELQSKTRATGLIDEGLPAEVGIPQGSALVVTDGAFAGFGGMCTWSRGKRVGVLLDLFGRRTEVGLDAAQVRVA